MRYELSDDEWATIRPMLPDKPRGVPRVDDRRVLNGIFWVVRSGAPWRDVPISFGPYTPCYNRFVRRRCARVWCRIAFSAREIRGAGSPSTSRNRPIGRFRRSARLASWRFTRAVAGSRAPVSRCSSRRQLRCEIEQVIGDAL
jgi:transposase